MTYSPLLIVHIICGLGGVVSGWLAILTRKGSPLHRRSGDAFVISMVIMAVAGLYLAVLKSQTLNIVVGLFTFYLVTSGWLTVQRATPLTRRAEVALMLLGVGIIVVPWLRMTGRSGGAIAGSLLFDVVMLLAVVGDVRMLVRGGIAGAQRMVRHIWRMGIALFIATASLFVGTSGNSVGARSGLRARLFTPEIRSTHLPMVPVWLVLILTVFWLFRVRGTYRKVGSAS